MTVLGLVLTGVGALLAQIRAVDAAGEAARRASRDDVAGARAVADRLPTGTEVLVEPDAETVRVRVRVPPLGGAMPGLRIAAEAVAAREPAVAAPTGGEADTDGAGPAPGELDDGPREPGRATGTRTPETVPVPAGPAP